MSRYRLPRPQGAKRGTDHGARIPLGGPIDGDEASEIRFVIVAAPSHVPSSFQLASGRVDLLQLVGITEAEHDLAKAEDSATLIALLQRHGAFPATDPTRASTV